LRGETEKLRGLIKDLKLSDRVKLVGKVGGVAKLKLIKNAQYLVVPSRSESFSIVCMEAFSLAKTVVCFNLPSLAWFSEKMAYKANPLSIKSYSEKLKKAHKMKKSSIKKGITAQNFVSNNFSLNSITGQYSDLIDEVAGLKILRERLSKFNSFVFLSPHFDDAILSCAGLISALKKQKKKISVINIFTSAGDGTNTFSAKRYLKKCGYLNAIKFMEDREIEDKKAFEELAIVPKNLGFTDALWRKQENLGFFGKKISKYFPEIVSIYPSYKKVSAGKISKSDLKLLKCIKDELNKTIINEKTMIFAPLANGNHTDHILTREVANKYKNKAFYLDCPLCYSEKPENKYLQKNNLVSCLFKADSKAKIKLIKFYKTQKEIMKKDLSIIFAEKYFVGEK
jgi:LmbE family N-acetylglucosaminyl deacetylase